MNDNQKIFAIAAGALVIGAILGFVVKGTSTSTPAPQAQQQEAATSSLPSGHPSVNGGQSGQSAQSAQSAQPSQPINLDNIIGKIESYVDEKYPGEWKAKGTTLSKGNYTENGNFKIADEISTLIGSGSMVSIFVGQERVSTTVVQTGSGRVLTGYPTPAEVDEVMKTGKEINGGTSSMGSTNYAKAFIPLKDKAGKTVGVMSIVVMN